MIRVVAVSLLFLWSVPSFAGVVSYADTGSSVTHGEDASLNGASSSSGRNFGGGGSFTYTYHLPVNVGTYRAVLRIMPSGWALQQGTILDSVMIGMVYDSGGISGTRADTMTFIYPDWVESDGDSTPVTTGKKECSWVKYSGDGIPTADSNWTTAGAGSVGNDRSTACAIAALTSSNTRGDTIRFWITDTAELNLQKVRTAGHRGGFRIQYGHSGTHWYYSRDGASPWFYVIYSHTETADDVYYLGYRNGVLGAVYRNGIIGKVYYKGWVTSW